MNSYNINISDVEAFLSRSTDITAVVVGDLMLDEYLWGDTHRISPEAPVAIVNVGREDTRLGGAGNVVNNLRVLGAKVVLASVLGDDSDGALICKRLQQAQVDIEAVIHDSGRITSRKTRILSGNQQMLRIDRESKQQINADVEARLLEKLTLKLTNADVVFLSDYGKGVLSHTLIQHIVERAKAINIPVVVDPKGCDYAKYYGATLLTPNRREAAQASGIIISDDASLCAAGDKILHMAGLKALVLTRSEQGMSIFQPDRNPVHLPTRSREVYDVSGAGDTVLTVVGLGLAAGFSVEQAAFMANIAAGVVVGKVGTSTASPAELVEAAGFLLAGDKTKICDPHALQIVLRRLRQMGRKVVFTNGCFDLLHAGHVSYLQRARELGDVLVLGLNSDASVRRLKGESRPLVSETDRAVILAALACVDYVVVFDDDTPMELIALLQPDILVKGSDYTEDNVVGADLVRQWGGRVELMPFISGRSTTALVRKINSTVPVD
ncbi:MAG: D-glycero-beta-D-manno-heptose-7-phosphate kinase [Desulfuromonadaceae bacterium]|nr:D-glycero-beta-D-manno-heptose-7-phosphate kinase [Desulfuromonadaceae bacterium]